MTHLRHGAGKYREIKKCHHAMPIINSRRGRYSSISGIDRACMAKRVAIVKYKHRRNGLCRPCHIIIIERGMKAYKSENSHMKCDENEENANGAHVAHQDIYWSRANVDNKASAI